MKEMRKYGTAALLIQKNYRGWIVRARLEEERLARIRVVPTKKRDFFCLNKIRLRSKKVQEIRVNFE